MCARYETLPETHSEPFSQTRIAWVSPRIGEVPAEMFPGYTGAVVRLRRGEPGLDALRWGLIPFWAPAPDAKRFGHTFNARAETLETVASFREPFRRRRCLVPALAFFEFPLLDGRKVCHRVAAADGSALVFAGLWDRWSDGDQEIYSYTIVTTEPAPGLRWLHPRIPVVLSAADQDAWLDPQTPLDHARSLLSSPAPESLIASPFEPATPQRAGAQPLDIQTDLW